MLDSFCLSLRMTCFPCLRLINGLDLKLHGWLNSLLDVIGCHCLVELCWIYLRLRWELGMRFPSPKATHTDQLELKSKSQLTTITDQVNAWSLCKGRPHKLLHWSATCGEHSCICLANVCFHNCHVHVGTSRYDWHCCPVCSYRRTPCISVGGGVKGAAIFKPPMDRFLFLFTKCGLLVVLEWGEARREMISSLNMG